MFVVNGILSVLLFFGIIVAQPEPVKALDKKVCAFQTVDAKRWTDHEVVMTIKCFSKRFGVSTDKMLYIAYRESRYNEKAFNSWSHALGLYQHLEKYWSGRVRNASAKLERFDIKKRHWYNPRVNVVTTLVYIKKNGWSAWNM